MESVGEKLIESIAPLIAPLGYEVVHLEIQTHRQRLLRLFIDHADPSNLSGIGIEDCARVSRALDEPLDQLQEIDAIFRGSYELEVSSPGTNRPLRLPKDYERFTGQEARIHVFRPLTAEESGNAGYQAKNPRQKNFYGRLLGLKDGKALLAIPTGSLIRRKAKKKGKASLAQPETNSAEEVSIPLPLISKANLEPRVEAEFLKEREENESI